MADTDKLDAIELLIQSLPDDEIYVLRRRLNAELKRRELPGTPPPSFWQERSKQGGQQRQNRAQKVETDDDD